jgi:hypothetical protein
MLSRMVPGAHAGGSGGGAGGSVAVGGGGALAMVCGCFAGSSGPHAANANMDGETNATTRSPRIFISDS